MERPVTDPLLDVWRSTAPETTLATAARNSASSGSNVLVVSE